MSNALALIALLLQYSTKITEIGTLITNANNEGRDVSDTELDALFAADDAAKARFQTLINAAGTLP